MHPSKKDQCTTGYQSYYHRIYHLSLRTTMDCAQVNHDEQLMDERSSSPPLVQRRMSTIGRQTSLYESIQQRQRDTAATKLRSLRRSCIETTPPATTSLTAAPKLIDLPVIVKAPRNGSLLPRSTSLRERYIPPPVIDLARQSLLRCGLQGSRTTSFQIGRDSLGVSTDFSRSEENDNGSSTAEL